MQFMCERKVCNYFKEKPIVFEPQQMQRNECVHGPIGTYTPFRKLRSCYAFTSTTTTMNLCNHCSFALLYFINLICMPMCVVVVVKSSLN